MHPRSHRAGERWQSPERRATPNPAAPPGLKLAVHGILECKNQSRLPYSAHTRTLLNTHTHTVSLTHIHTHACRLSPRFRKTANPKRTSRLLWLEALLVTCRDRMGQEGSFPKLSPCDAHPPPSLWARAACPPSKGAAAPEPGGHPPCPEGAARAPRAVTPLSGGVGQGCLVSPPLPGAAGELECWQEQLIFQGLGCDVIAVLGTSSPYSSPALPPAQPLSPAGCSF